MTEPILLCEETDQGGPWVFMRRGWECKDKTEEPKEDAGRKCMLLFSSSQLGS